MLRVLPRFLSDSDIQRIVALTGASHHDDEGGHVSTGARFRAKKPHHLPWLADAVCREILGLAISGLVGVDPDMQVYRLCGEHSAVPLHVDEDYETAGLLARYSVLLRLNSDYTGGETRFFGKEVVLPPVGGGIVFRHDVPHEGLPLGSGEKLIVKTDLLVSREQS